jgi:hypothetical protein
MGLQEIVVFYIFVGARCLGRQTNRICAKQKCVNGGGKTSHVAAQ